MTVKSHLNEIFNSVTYRVDKFLIDPGDEWEGFENVKVVLLTHCHFDHIYGLNRVVELNPDVNVYTNRDGMEMLLNARKNLSHFYNTDFVFNYPERIVAIPDNIILQKEPHLKVKAIFTPGHNKSCITWIIDDAIFSGDAYIPGIKTVTNLPNGNKIQAEESENLIQRLAMGLKIYPGHTI